jgi:hypothetical protein
MMRRVSSRGEYSREALAARGVAKMGVPIIDERMND